jgi:hypothetical protein
LDDGNPHWFLALRGITSLAASNWIQLAERPFSPMLVRTVKPVEYSSNPDGGHLASFHSLLAARRGSSTENEREGRELEIAEQR